MPSTYQDFSLITHMMENPKPPTIFLNPFRGIMRLEIHDISPPALAL